MILPTDSAKRKEYPIYTGCFAYFPRAIAAIANQSYKCNEKHNPGEVMHWAKEKSNDHMDCIARHMLDQLDTSLDPIEEKTATAWRALAELEIALEEKEVKGNIKPIKKTRKRSRKTELSPLEQQIKYNLDLIEKEQ